MHQQHDANWFRAQRQIALGFGIEGLAEASACSCERVSEEQEKQCSTVLSFAQSVV